MSVPFFIAGTLVVSLYGDGAGDRRYGFQQGSPIVLEQVGPDGRVTGTLKLPQATTVVGDVTEYAISGEYGSKSEGSLALSVDGHWLLVAGYGIGAANFNRGGGAVYGNAALAQTTSRPGGQYTAVPRVIARIGADGGVDTSTALEGIYDTDNPRSVASVDGSQFYISGQGTKTGDATQGVFLAADGARRAAPIDISTDTRTLQIFGGRLYVSRDSALPGSPDANIASYGVRLPTTPTEPRTLPGIGATVRLGAAQANTLNGSLVGQDVALSPEDIFFANATTLYVADGGDPKGGGIGDGGLQKWLFDGTAWQLAYTLSAGLDLAPNSGPDGVTTGLIGLAGRVTGSTVQLYATNLTIGGLGQTCLYGITDALSATTGGGERFTPILRAAPDTVIRGVALAPTAIGLAAPGRNAGPDVVATDGGGKTMRAAPRSR